MHGVAKESMLRESSDPGLVARGGIASLTPDEQVVLILELTDYANYLIQSRTRWIRRGVLPHGYDGSALALEAIARVLDGRRRPWDPEKEPTLTAYMKSVVKSIFSSEIQPAAERERVEIAAIDDQGRDITLEVASRNPGPDAQLEVRELKDRILASFDLEEDQLVLLCLFEGMTAPADIAAATGIQTKDVNRIKQKIKRRLIGLREEG
jgi:hypothetical protein